MNFFCVGDNMQLSSLLRFLVFGLYASSLAFVVVFAFLSTRLVPNDASLQHHHQSFSASEYAPSTLRQFNGSTELVDKSQLKETLNLLKNA